MDKTKLEIIRESYEAQLAIGLPTISLEQELFEYLLHAAEGNPDSRKMQKLTAIYDELQQVLDASKERNRANTVPSNSPLFAYDPNVTQGILKELDEINESENKTLRTKQPKIISAFPGTGKTYYAERMDSNDQCIVLDLDSSAFSKDAKGNPKSEFPANYIERIKTHMEYGAADVIFVSTHTAVREALKENDIPYTLVYPERELNTVYLERYFKRGNDASFILLMATKWEQFIDELDAETYPETIELEDGEYISDIMEGMMHDDIL